MEDPRNMKVEPAGRSEGDWSAAPLSSSGLPKYEEGEFSHLVKQGAENAAAMPEEAAVADQDEEIVILSLEVERFSEEEQLDLLDQHMSMLLQAGGKALAPGDKTDEESGFRRLIKRPFSWRERT